MELQHRRRPPGRMVVSTLQTGGARVDCGWIGLGTVPTTRHSVWHWSEDNGMEGYSCTRMEREWGAEWGKETLCAYEFYNHHFIILTSFIICLIICLSHTLAHGLPGLPAARQC